MHFVNTQFCGLSESQNPPNWNHKNNDSFTVKRNHFIFATQRFD